MTPHPQQHQQHVPEDLYASWSPSLSPDGRRVAFVSDRSGLPEVWLRDRAGTPPEPVPLSGRRVVSVSWSPTGDWLACLVAPPGRSRNEVWLVRPDGRDAHLAAGAAPGTATVSGGRSRGWTADGDLVVTEICEVSQVLRVDPDTGRRHLLAEGPLTVAVDVTPDGRTVLLRSGPRGSRELVVPLQDSTRDGPGAGARVRSSEHGCLSPDGRTVWAASDAQAELAELVSTDGLRLAHPDGELEAVSLSGDGRTAALVWNVDGGLSALSLLDVASAKDRAVAPLPRAVVSGCTLTHDGGLLALTAEGPTDPRGVWLLDTREPAARFTPLSSPGQGALHASRGATTDLLDPGRVIAPDLLRLVSGDGSPLTGWLYRPAGPPPYPTVLWLHGGPEGQERPVYNSLYQSLLAEGVAVFTPNVRGSSGLGRAFRCADDRYGRYGAFDDVAACAEHLVATGVATPGRLGVMGRSYGGYLTLAVLVRRPELFQLGVDVCGMSNLETFYARTEPWIAAAAVPKYGHPVHDRELLRDLSPIHRVGEIRAPLLIVHGADDTNVPLAEATQLAAALEVRGLPHRLLVFPGEGHELLGSHNRVAFVRAVIDWVLEHL